MTGNPTPGSTRSRTPGAVFLAIGVVFVAVGSSGQRAFLGVGAAFIALGIVFLVSPPRVVGPK